MLEKLKELYKKYELTPDDKFTHKHYTIITRQGIDKIQAIEKIFINYEVFKCEKDFAVVKAHANKGDAKIETFGSAVYGGKEWNKAARDGKGAWDEKGNTTSWYIMEMAEKRAMSRAVLKLTGFYELGVFGEDEAEDFKRPDVATQKSVPYKGVNEKPTLHINTVPFEKCVKKLAEGATMMDIEDRYRLTPEVRKALTK